MTPRPLKAILFSDGKPGHYHQAEGVIAALGRLQEIETLRINVSRRLMVPNRVLMHLINLGAPPGLVLWLGYGLRPADIPQANVVVSAGGNTLPANAAAAKMRGLPNIFCGRMRLLEDPHVRVIIVADRKLARHANYLVTLPPTPVNGPATAQRPIRHLGPNNPPRVAGALIGGNSRAVRYTPQDWLQLVDFLRAAHKAHNISWVITTSRRSCEYINNALTALAGEPGSPIAKFIDYRTAGPGTLREVFASADAILCTDDSTSMISEAIDACLPLVSVRPKATTHETREAEYRDDLASRGWYRPLPIREATPERFLQALEDIRPRVSSQINELAVVLSQRLPAMFAAHVQPAPRPMRREAVGQYLGYDPVYSEA